MTFNELVREYKQLCKTHEVPEETVLYYLVELCHKENINLYMVFDEEVPETLKKVYIEGMQRILKHEPMQHVLGYSWFYGYKFIVNSDVLIPRVETEELVAAILVKMDEQFPDKKRVVADIGTGSGALAITLKKEESELLVYASDISEEALVVAKENASLNECDITFFKGDMLQPFIERNIQLDVLVCNPPYIPSNEVLEDFVYDHEPHVALFGGEDGLKFYREIFENCHKVLKPNSFMAFEIGYQQKQALTALLKQYLPNATVTFEKDMNQKDRMLFVTFTG